MYGLKDEKFDLQNSIPLDVTKKSHQFECGDMPWHVCEAKMMVAMSFVDASY